MVTNALDYAHQQHGLADVLLAVSSGNRAEPPHVSLVMSSAAQAGVDPGK
jgi:hypothetical protein